MCVMIQVTDPKSATNVDLNDIRLVKKLLGGCQVMSVSVSRSVLTPLVFCRLGATTDDTELVEGLVLSQKAPRPSEKRSPSALRSPKVDGGPGLPEAPRECRTGL